MRGFNGITAGKEYKGKYLNGSTKTTLGGKADAGHVKIVSVEREITDKNDHIRLTHKTDVQVKKDDLKKGAETAAKIGITIILYYLGIPANSPIPRPAY